MDVKTDETCWTIMTLQGLNGKEEVSFGRLGLSQFWWKTVLVHHIAFLTCIRLGKRDTIVNGDKVVPNVQLLVMMIFAKFVRTANTWSCILSHSSRTHPSHPLIP